MKSAHRPLLWIVLFYALGIMIDDYFHLAFSYVSLLIALFACIIILTWRKKRISTVCLFMLFVVSGMIHSQSWTLLHKDHIVHVTKYYKRKDVALRGVIISDVQTRRVFNSRKTTLTLKIREIESPWGWRQKNGKILVNIFRDMDLAYGDDIQIVGRLHYPYNFSKDHHFSYREYLKRRGIRLILSVKKDADIQILEKQKGNIWKSVSLKVRNQLKSQLNDALSPNEAGIMRAILLGDRSNIPKHVRELFVRTGTAHILAISGLHVGVVTGLFLVFIKLLPIARRFQYGLTIILISSYAFMTGGRPSVVRASIMAVVFLISYIIEKEPDAINTLSFSALLILLINPLNLFDVGFQLSFICVLAIIILSPIIEGMAKTYYQNTKSTIQTFLTRSISVSLAVWLGVVGLIAYYFGIITPVTILANVVVVPCLTIIVGLGVALLVAGACLPICTMVIATCLKLALNITVGIIFLFAKIPLAYFYVKNINLLIIVIYYVILAGLLVLYRLRIRRTSASAYNN